VRCSTTRVGDPDMAFVLFYEKPGCINNTRQKALLTESGHRVEARDLLAESWTPALLRDFFGSLPLSEWFNRTAPAVTSGEVNPEALSETEALDAMCADPLLIRRPLMEAEGRRVVGFDAAVVAGWLGLKIEEEGNLTDCPRPAGDACREPS
jgi:nitrogenase-associated protein